ncbi:sarcosine oxidase subunit gamma [Salipiger aestuarii]|uniref:Heterotetrameric sarcosine oxidase gamma subunit n=1 Tax=Salipiger aestuarii TaxID=568098 RepID=A0A327YEX1_9RHOB|nr:sarcosine oxidase subunit gamma family protein [Salipiger aestuarii]KAA8608657.1 sarcosine oxidase subunit gamma [Salipiger aestuarii]KAB2542579.1 sarcosine oxidase subunit gamma [Salipiger aestuarii]RAK19061.1 heterotetrameric sarcosine oxidase gamma subunit [Salipiger aestuarii]
MSDPSDVMAPMQGARSEGVVTVEALPAQGQITLRCDLSDDFRWKLGETLGFAVPEPLGATSDGDRALLWMSPDELLLLCPYDAVPTLMAQLGQVFDGWFIAIADVSDARAQFRITGGHLRDVLAKLTPVDMAPQAFVPGMVRRSRLAQVAAGYWMRDADTMQIFVFRSVAEYAFGVLTLAAGAGGEVGFHVR